ncbi:unnamed protein product, partial [Rotaria sp. Silwood1]
PPVIQQPFIQTTNQQIQQVTPTYIPSTIQPSISSYIPQTIQQPFLQTTNQEIQQPISKPIRSVIQKQRP